MIKTLAVLIATLSACSSVPHRAIANQAQPPVTIAESRSTNTPAWNIVVGGDGSATLSVLDTANVYSLAADLADKFFADAAAAKATDIPGPKGCAKPVSFATTRTVSWQGWTSPDLSCPVTPNTPWSALADDLAAILKVIPVYQVISDIEHPIRQYPANVPHCLTPDGRYSINVNSRADHTAYVMVEDESRRTRFGAPFEFYDVPAANPFVGKASSLNRYSNGEPFNLTLAHTDYDKDTDASLSTTFIDQSTDNDGKPVNLTPVQISYDHVNCTRWYR